MGQVSTQGEVLRGSSAPNGGGTHLEGGKSYTTSMPASNLIFLGMSEHLRAVPISYGVMLEVCLTMSNPVPPSTDQSYHRH